MSDFSLKQVAKGLCISKQAARGMVDNEVFTHTTKKAANGYDMYMIHGDTVLEIARQRIKETEDLLARQKNGLEFLQGVLPSPSS